MPPKKPPAQSASQKSLGQLTSAAATASYERKPQPHAQIPEATTVAALWTPSSTPRELFPEWPAATALASENWGNGDALYEDPTPPSTDLFLAAATVEWKRPSQFLPPLVEQIAPSAAALAPVVADPKHAKKAAAPAPAATAKKGEPEPVKKAAKAPKYGHIVYIAAAHDGNESHHHHQQHQHASGHPTGAAAATELKKGATAGAAPSTPLVHPASSSSSSSSSLLPAPPRRIVRDFQRLWSGDQEDEWALWRKEEERIEKEKQVWERVAMEFEDATAFIINDRPRQLLNEDDVQAEDLVDDGQDEDDENEEQNALLDAAAAMDTSPYGGFTPPPRMDIASNAISKPEIPHGAVVQPAFASYFRLVDQLYKQWTSGGGGDHTPYLWEAIYPQDANGVPVYNAAGKYSVRLFLSGKWRRVDVDDKLPVDGEGNIQLASSSMKNELWPALLVKALIKVASWLGVSMEQQEDATMQQSQSIRLASTVITALTGWKVTRHDDNSVFEGNFQSLMEYNLQDYHTSESPKDLVLDDDDGTSGASSPREATSSEILEISHDSESVSHKPVRACKPRALLCCTATQGLQDHLACCEVSVLVDIVGDAGNATLKTVNLNGPLSIPEELLTREQASFLVVHPPSHQSDLITETWLIDHDGTQVPFVNAPVQFCVISSMKKATASGGGSGAGGQSSGEADDAGERKAKDDADFVDVIVTLTRTPPIQQDNSSLKLAEHLHVDPHGSVILVEDLALEKYTCASSSSFYVPRRPRVFKIDTTSSSLLRLPRGEMETMAFRVYVQPSCRYGYSLQVESQQGGAKVDWQVASTYWRNVWDLQVISADGAYPVMLPQSWNILFKQSIELAAPPPEAAPEAASPPPELFVDLHVSDPDLASSIHVSIVNHDATHVVPLAGLHGSAVLPSDSASYTLIVECCPRILTPEGKWHLTLASNRFFKHATVHQPRLTVFTGVYEPNKPLVCLRDIVTQPKKTTSTSFQFQLDSHGKEEDQLAAKLEVMDLATGQPLAKVSGRGLARLYQLPSSTRAPDDPNEDKGGYVIQASIDQGTCHVPDWMKSVRPYSYKNATASQAEIAKKNPIDEDAQEETGHTLIETTRNTQKVHWRLLCWSIEEVKLEFDRAQELRFDAIRATWADAAKDRDAHGPSSRLFYLGKADAAEIAMQDDGLTDDQVAKYKARVEWLQQATQRVPGLTQEDHIRVLPECGDGEVVRTPEDMAHDNEELQLKMNATSSLLQSIRDDRIAAKETRANELKELVHSFKNQRKEAEKQRQELYAKRDHVRVQGLSSTGPHAS